MATSISFNGVSYSIPANNERGWGTSLSAYLIALSTGALSKAGGTFTLTNEVDFGATYGLKSSYFKSRGTVSSTGIVRLANAESIGWRNAANSADLLLTVNSSNLLEFNGAVVLPALGAANTVLNVNNAGTAIEYDKIVNANVSDTAAIVYSKLSLSDSIVDADISTSAAIAYNKLNTLAANNRALISDGSGYVSISSVTTTELNRLSGLVSPIVTESKVQALSHKTSLGFDDIDPTGSQLTLSVDSGGAMLSNSTLQFQPGSAVDTIIVLPPTSGDIIFASNGTVPMPGNTNTWTRAQIVDGSTDEIQLRVQGNGTQTSDIFVVEKSDGTDVLQVTNVNGTKIRGTTTNDSAAAGFVGEIVTATGSNTSMSTTAGTATDVTGASLSLTAGDWDIEVDCRFSIGTNNGTAANYRHFFLELYNSTDTALIKRFYAGYANSTLPGSNRHQITVSGHARVSISGSKTVVLRGISVENASSTTQGAWSAQDDLSNPPTMTARRAR